MENESLYILDGHAQIYRAYYAVLGLTSPTGEPTNATFGFCNMLLKLFQTRKPTHVVMAVDAGSAARIEMHAAYKAQRKPMPEDMPVQIDRICQILATVGIPVFRHEGCEADDVIATLVSKIRRDPQHAHAMLYLCTKDKDLDQLIDDRTRLFDIQTAEELDAAGLRAKKGYGPEQARDVLALTGDTVDNIPGVPGVGPKTAAKWIAEYGSLDNLLAHKDDLKGKVGEALRANLPVLDQARKLVELMFDLPLELDWNAARVQIPRLAALAPIFQELGFARMLGMLEEIVGQASAAPPTLPRAPQGNGGVLPRKPSLPAPEEAAHSPADIPGGLFDHASSTPASSTPATIEEETLSETPTEEFAPSPHPSGILAPVQGDYRLINTPEKLAQMLTDLRQQLETGNAKLETPTWLAVDTETSALGPMNSDLCGISLCATEGLAYYIAVKGTDGDVLEPALVRQQLTPLLTDPHILKVGQNLKYDLNVLRVFGIELAGVHFDTMVASYVLDSSRLSHSMDALAIDLLSLKPIPITDLIGKGAKQISFADVPVQRAAGYSAEDADVTLRLAHVLYPKLLATGLDKLFFDVEMPLVQVLADMEYDGVSVDTAFLSAMSAELGKKMFALRGQIKIAAGVDFNQDSPKQLAEVLFKTLKLPVIKRTKTGPSTDIEVLEELSDKHPVAALIVEYRQLTKLKNTYLDALVAYVNPKTHRVHASFNQTIAATGRLSSSDPNLQNIPIRTDLGREIRRAFIPADPTHVLITADYSQIELRMLAHYCQDPALLRAFAENKDVHRVVAAEIFNVPEDQITPDQRAIAKTVNFGIVYGQTGFGLSKVLHIPQQQAADFIAAYKKRFPQIERFSQECIKQASLHGYVTTILGRRRLIPDINSPIQSRRQFGQRAAMNSVIQGSAADLIKLAMVQIHRKLANNSPRLAGGALASTNGTQTAKVIMQIHDELVVECPEPMVESIAEMVRHEMEHALPLQVPLKVALAWGKNWLEAK